MFIQSACLQGELNKEVSEFKYGLITSEALERKVELYLLIMAGKWWFPLSERPFFVSKGIFVVDVLISACTGSLLNRDGLLG